MTNREFISGIRHTLRTLNQDDRFSNRFILNLASNYVQTLLSNRPLTDIFRDDSFSTFLDCFEMERIDTAKCGVVQFRTCNTVMKSTKQLPKIYNSKIGLSILNVFNIDRSIKYDRLRSLGDFINQQKRIFGKKSKYYYVQDNYLYILNSETELVHIEALFADQLGVIRASTCSECKDCIKVLDLEFKCPSKYLSGIQDQVVNTLRVTKTIVEDENPDGDNNQKGAKA